MGLIEQARAARALADALDAAVAAEARALIRQATDEPDITGIPPWSEVSGGDVAEDSPGD